VFVFQRLWFVTGRERERERQNENEKEKIRDVHPYICVYIVSGHDSYTLSRSALLYFRIPSHETNFTAYPFSALFGRDGGRDVYVPIYIYI